jgi:hypothetical protein
MEFKLSLKARLKQFFCQHKNGAGWSCCTKGINSKEGYWHITYDCHSCRMSFGDWIKATDEEVEKLFGKDKHKLG